MAGRKFVGTIRGLDAATHRNKHPEVVVMGSIARNRFFRGPSYREFDQAARILDLLGISRPKDCVYTEIRGGERQMVLVARALMREPYCLLMDEPIANLDLGNQMRVHQQVRLLVRQGMGVMMPSHVPDHAFSCCSKAAILGAERPFQVGAVEEVSGETVLSEVYDTDVRIPRHGRGNIRSRPASPS